MNDRILFIGAMVGTLLMTGCTPVIRDFSAAPRTVCPGDTSTLRWDVKNARTVRLNAPGVNPKRAADEQGKTGIRIGNSDVLVTLTAIGLSDTKTAHASIHVFHGPVEIPLSAIPRCEGHQAVVTAAGVPHADWPQSLVVGSVFYPLGRTGTLSHLGVIAPFTSGSGDTNAFSGRPYSGEWILRYDLIPPEKCQTTPTGSVIVTGGDEGSAAIPPETAATLIQADCPGAASVSTTASGSRITCGRIGQQCCAGANPCDEGAACTGGQCVATQHTCTGAVATQKTQQFTMFVVNPETGCGAEYQVPVLANSYEEARGCLAKQGLSTLTADDVQRGRHHFYGTTTSGTCCSGDFYSSDADAQRCANASCPGTPVLGGNQTCP